MPLRFEVTTELLEIDKGSPRAIDVLKVKDGDDVLLIQTVDEDLLREMWRGSTNCLSSVVKRQTLEAVAVKGRVEPDWSHFYVGSEPLDGHSHVYVKSRTGNVVLGHLFEPSSGEYVQATSSYRIAKTCWPDREQAFQYLRECYESVLTGVAV